MDDLFLYFQIKCSILFYIYFFLSSGFCLVNSEFGEYLALDHSLVYSYPKRFESNLGLNSISLKPYFSITISV